MIVGATAAIGLAFWHPLQKEEHSHVHYVTMVFARSVQTELLEEIQSEMLEQVQLARQWGLEEKLSRSQWDARAKLFIAHHPGHLAVQWVDANYRVRFLITEPESEAYRNTLTVTEVPLRRLLEDLALRGEQNAILAPAFRLWNGNIGRRIIVPIYRSKQFLGFLITVINEEEVIHGVLAGHAGLGYAIAVLEDNDEIYRTPGSNPENARAWAQDADLRLPGALWRVRVWPEAELLRRMQSKLPLLLLIMGSVIGLLLFLTVDLARSAYRTGQALQESQARYLGIISSARDAIITVDENQRITMFNRSAEEIFRCPSSDAIGQPVNQFIPERFREAHRQHIQNFGRTGVTSRSMYSPGTLWGVRADGEEFPVEASISQTNTATEELYTVILRDISMRKRTEEELRRARDELESKVEERTADLRSANQKLETEIDERRQAEESLQGLSGRLLNLRDEERRRIARELHDSTAQILGAVAIDLEKVRRLVANGDSLKAQPLLAQSSDLVERATSELRTISYLLHPPMLDDLGLEGVLPWYTAGFSSRSGIRVNLYAQGDLGRFPAEIELTLFRILQEALTNIHRHSGSSTVEITVRKDSDRVTLQIVDHGCGIPPEALNAIRSAKAVVGVGTAGMRERVRQIGGSLQIDSGGGGTSITATIPINTTT